MCTVDEEERDTSWSSEGREHAGIILSVQMPIGGLLKRMLRLLDQVTADEMKNNLRYLSDFADRAT